MTFSVNSYYGFNFVEILCLVFFQWTKKDSRVPHMGFWNTTDRYRLTSGAPVYHSHSSLLISTGTLMLSIETIVCPSDGT